MKKKKSAKKTVIVVAIIAGVAAAAGIVGQIVSQVKKDKEEPKRDGNVPLSDPDLLHP